MALTPIQKKWAVGGALAAGALAVGWFIHRRSVQAVVLPGGHPIFLPAGPSGFTTHGRHEHRKKFRHSEKFSENERGEYGRKKHHRHRGHKHG